MPAAVSKTSANAIARARHHLHGITGYTIRSDILVRHIIEHGRGYDQTRRLALVGDMALRAAIIGIWYLAGSNVRCDENQMRDLTNNRRLASIGTATAIPSILVSSVDSAEPPYPDTNIAKEAPQNPEHHGEASRRFPSGSRPGVKARIVAPQVGEIRLATTMEAIFGAVYEDSGRDVGAVDKAMTAIGLYRPAPFAEGGSKHRKAVSRQTMLEQEWEGVVRRLREESAAVNANGSEVEVDSPLDLRETKDVAKEG